MQKKYLLTVAIALLAAACSKVPATQSTAPAAQNTPAQTVQGQGSFKDLLAMGKTLKCESGFTSQGNTSTGTMYVAGGKMRGDFSSQVEGKTMQMHMVVKDQTSYSWVEGLGQTMGFKSSITQSAPAQGSAPSKSVNIDQQVSYNCQPWSEDDSMFNLPSGVTFSDASQMAAPAHPITITPPTGGGSQNSAACAACNNAGSQKAQCLAALGCK